MRPLLHVAVIGLALSVSIAVADVDPSQRTADLPDSWLVLYNSSSPDSVAWKDWYLEQRGIPPENTLGLDVSTNESITQADRIGIQNQVYAHLVANPDLEARIMGIVVGHLVPLHDNVPGGSLGGYSVDNMLTDLTDVPDLYPDENPDASPGWAEGFPLPPRLTKATMTPYHYMVARLDGLDLESVKELTRRSQTLQCLQNSFSDSAKVYYDYEDTGKNGKGIWEQLEWAVADPLLESLPWVSFDSDLGIVADDVCRHHWSALGAWYNRFVPGTAGQRLLAYDCNSYGATTVRSTTNQTGRFVPNALFNGGYAAAIGATAEPYYAPLGDPGPYNKVILLGLESGWTLGEAFYTALRYNNGMWILVGDPLLQLPYWFDAPLPEGTPVGTACAAVNEVSGARSCREHGSQGQLCLDLGESDIEPRQGGVQTVELDMRLATGSISATIEGGEYGGGEPLISIGTGVNGPATKVTLAFDPPLPDRGCYRIRLDGDSKGTASMRTLQGDSNRSGLVNTVDTSVARVHFGDLADGSNLAYDTDCNGWISTTDTAFARLNFGTTAQECP